MAITACTATTQPTTTVIPPSTGQVAATVPAPDPAPVVWTRNTGQDSFGGDNRQVMQSVTTGGPGLVAVGWDETDSGENAAVWTSPDGITWTRIPNNDALGRDGGRRMLSVTAGGPGLVAVGWDETSGDEDAAVWTSPDGMTWTRIPNSDTLGGEDGQVMLSVTAGGPGLVVVGFHIPGGDQDAAVWTSVDGITWTRVPHDDALGGDGAQRMLSVTTGGPGLVAVGQDGSGGGEDAAVWTSPDGITWTRVPHHDALGGDGGQRMSSVIAGGPGLVAVGWDDTDAGENAAVWTSPDGITWTRIPNNDALGRDGGRRMLSVTTGGPGLVAVGWDESQGHLDAVVWTATTGSG